MRNLRPPTHVPHVCTQAGRIFIDAHSFALCHNFAGAISSNLSVLPRIYVNIAADMYIPIKFHKNALAFFPGACVYDSARFTIMAGRKQILIAIGFNVRSAMLNLRLSMRACVSDHMWTMHVVFCCCCPSPRLFRYHRTREMARNYASVPPHSAKPKSTARPLVRA